MAELTEELKVLVTAEVEKAINQLRDVDKQTKKTTTGFESLGKTIAAAFGIKQLISFARQGIAAYESSAQAVNVLESTIKATGASAWTSSAQIQKMASTLQNVTNYSSDAVISMQSVLLGFKNIKGDNFEAATNAILDMATVMRMDLGSAAQAVGKALDDPINGIDSLKRQGFAFTDSQKELMRSLLDTGDAAAAQKIILDELESTYGGAAEAGVKASSQLKNALSNFAGGYVQGFAEQFDESSLGKKIVNWINYAGDALKRRTFVSEMQMATLIGTDEAYEKAFNKLTKYEDKVAVVANRVKVLNREIAYYKKQLDEDNYIDDQFREDDKRHLAERVQSLKHWKDIIDQYEESIKSEQQLQVQENERIENENAIYDLMTAIAKEYEKLSKNDPVMQLQEYQKQLDKIQKDREKLSLFTGDVDTSAALKQLEYNEKAIQEKMKSIREKMQKDGKKSWQQYFEDVTGVSKDSFSNGKGAGELYVKSLQDAFNNSKSLSELLGNKISSKDLAKQMGELEGKILELINIPADKIDEVYKLSDESIKKLIDEYIRLNNEKKKFEVAEGLDELNEKLQKLSKSEREIFMETLKSNGATVEQIAKANELYDQIEELQKKDSKENFTWEDLLEEKLTSGIKKLNLFKENAEKANKTLADLGKELVSMSFTSAISGITEVGKALGQGENAGQNMKEALLDMTQQILDQLPTLFLQAGLQLIADKQYALGFGLIGAGVTQGFVNGINAGFASRIETNAKGGVYGDYTAFAKGGAFRNQIVSSPTLFRFAKGSGFGTGLMGEAGPEAIMPLRRGADGTLGVEASGAQVNFALLVEVNNYSQERVQAQETTDENGQRRLQIMIGSAINAHITSGKADRAMSARYGLKAQGV